MSLGLTLDIMFGGGMAIRIFGTVDNEENDDNKWGDKDMNHVGRDDGNGDKAGGVEGGGGKQAKKTTNQKSLENITIYIKE